MRRLLIVFALSMFVLLFSSCEVNSVREGRRGYKKYFKEILKDPSSLKIYNEEIISENDIAVTFVLDVGAKNSFGGYVRKTYTIKTIGITVAKVEDYDVRLLPKPEEKKEEKVIPFEYKGRTANILIPVDLESKIGKTITLRNDILAGKKSFDLVRIIKAVKEDNSEDFNFWISQGCKIIRKGERIVVDSCITYFNGDTQKHATLFAIKYKDKNMVVEQSAAF